MTLLEQYMADYQRVCAEKVALQEQYETEQHAWVCLDEERVARITELENAIHEYLSHGQVSKRRILVDAVSFPASSPTYHVPEEHGRFPAVGMTAPVPATQRGHTEYRSNLLGETTAGASSSASEPKPIDWNVVMNAREDENDPMRASNQDRDPASEPKEEA